ncbi:hypothetical protein FHETE_11161 [Fusarium heterosporum]|uniref:Uncharacterized protein n=1 Tax=Fusarium heterosporum TaxID=42747 RepID=A0A8H5SRH5_FUSHE|nr:hypothetical protein FHETE_11161 [Fusarium heterosporum]
MANTFEPTCASSTLGKWVEELYNRIFVHPDDQVSTDAMKNDITQNFIARINHDLFTRQTFMETILKFRVDSTTSIQSTRDIQVWEAPEGSGAGCVAQYLHFTDTKKETGVGSKSSTMLIASVKVIDGQRKLVDLTEVMKASE